MLMPSIFGENLFDDWFDEFPFYDFDKSMKNTEKKLYGKKAGRIMKTDIKEKKDGYELEIDLPGFTKDEINAPLISSSVFSKSNTKVLFFPDVVRFKRESVCTAVTSWSFLSTYIVWSNGSSNPV